MVVCGTILHHKNYLFGNCTIRNKYLIVINTPTPKNFNILTVLTTSQPKNKPPTPGCIKEKQLFFIEANTAFFPKPTWIQLETLEEHDQDSLINNPDVTKKPLLSVGMMAKIIKCLLESRANDISTYHREMICPPIKEGITNLQKKWAAHSNKPN